MNRTYTKTMQFYFGFSEGDEHTENAIVKFTTTPFVAATLEQPAEGGTVEITSITMDGEDIPQSQFDALAADTFLMESLFISAQECDAYAADEDADRRREEATGSTSLREILAHSALCLFAPTALIQLGMWWIDFDVPRFLSGGGF